MSTGAVDQDEPGPASRHANFSIYRYNRIKTNDNVKPVISSHTVVHFSNFFLCYQLKWFHIASLKCQ